MKKIPKQPLFLETEWGKFTFSPVEVENLIATNSRLGMIKVIRQLTNFGLREAKDVMESCCDLPQNMTQHSSGFFPSPTLNRDRVWDKLLSFPSFKEDDPRAELNENLLSDIEKTLASCLKDKIDPIPEIMSKLNSYRPKYKRMEKDQLPNN